MPAHWSKNRLKPRPLYSLNDQTSMLGQVWLTYVSMLFGLL